MSSSCDQQSHGEYMRTVFFIGMTMLALFIATLVFGGCGPYETPDTGACPCPDGHLGGNGECLCPLQCVPGGKRACTCDAGNLEEQACLEDGSGYHDCPCPDLCEPGSTTKCACADGRLEETWCLQNGSAYNECPCVCEEEGGVFPCACNDGMAGEKECSEQPQISLECSCASGDPAEAAACDACSLEHCAEQRRACEASLDCQAGQQCYEEKITGASSACPHCALMCDENSGSNGLFEALHACEESHCSTVCKRFQSCGMLNYFLLLVIGDLEKYSAAAGSCINRSCCDEGLACGEDIECYDALRYANAASGSDLEPPGEALTHNGCAKYDALVSCMKVCALEWPPCPPIP